MHHKSDFSYSKSIMASYAQDGLWSWLVCASATLSWLAALGFVFSFGIFFPVFMDYFQESREKTGNVICTLKRHDSVGQHLT